MKCPNNKKACRQFNKVRQPWLEVCIHDFKKVQEYVKHIQRMIVYEAVCFC